MAGDEGTSAGNAGSPSAGNTGNMVTANEGTVAQSTVTILASLVTSVKALETRLQAQAEAAAAANQANARGNGSHGGSQDGNSVGGGHQQGSQGRPRDTNKKAPVYPLPEVFDGDKTDLRRFIEKARAYEEFYHSTTSQTDLVRILLSRLTGDAEKWKIARSNDHRAKHPNVSGEDPPTAIWLQVSDFLLELQKAFGDPAERLEAYERYVNIKLVDFEHWPACLSAIRDSWALLPSVGAAWKIHGLIHAMPKEGQIRAHLAQDPRWQKWISTPAALVEIDVEKVIDLIGATVATCGYTRRLTTKGKALNAVMNSRTTRSTTSDSLAPMTPTQAKGVLEMHFVQNLSELSKEERQDLYAKKLCFCCRRPIPSECKGFRQCPYRKGAQATPESRKTALVMAALGDQRDDKGHSEDAVCYFMETLADDLIPEDDSAWEYTGDPAAAALMLLNSN